MARRSMTGFGRGEVEVDGRTWVCEIRSVNHRYLDVKVKLPKGYTPLEGKIKKKVQMFHERGRVDLSLSVGGDFSDLMLVKLNETLAREYKNKLVMLAKRVGVQGEIDLGLLASFPDVITRETGEEDLEAIWPTISQAIDKALINCESMRKQEGEALACDLNNRLDFFTETIDKVEAMLPDLIHRRQVTVNERLVKLLDDKQFDPMRLAQEVAVLADKTDVTEELVRLRSHIEQFKSFMVESGGVGRKLDFLIQEFLREVNTVASKINDVQVAHLTVDLKAELEKMREQIQNVE